MSNKKEVQKTDDENKKKVIFMIGSLTFNMLGAENVRYK